MGSMRGAVVDGDEEREKHEEEAWYERVGFQEGVETMISDHEVGRDTKEKHQKKGQNCWVDYHLISLNYYIRLKGGFRWLEGLNKKKMYWIWRKGIPNRTYCRIFISSL